MYSSPFDISKSYTGQYGDFSSYLKSGSEAGGGTKFGGGMDPLSIGLGLGSSVIGGLFGMGQARTSASIAQAQLAAQNQAILEGRDQTKAALGSSMWGPLFAAGAGGDRAFEREKEAKKWLAGPFAERQLGLSSEEAKRVRLGLISPESKEFAQLGNRLAIDRATKERRAITDAMFGSTSSSYFA